MPTPSSTPSSSPVQSPLLTPKAAAAHLQGAITVGTLAKWRCSGTGPAFIRLGNKIFYQTATLDAWVESRRVQPGEAA